jgi:diaminopimelate decarboxylase
MEIDSQGRPPAFSYKAPSKSRNPREAPVLHCDDVPLARLAERFGTPLYVYSASAIRERYRTFDQAFRKVPHTVCYSIKANSNLAILRLLGRMGCGFDVVSAGELDRVLQVNRSAAKKVVFSGVGKTSREIMAALKANILLFNVESESELRTLAECASRLKKRAQVAFRVNPDVSANTHPYISTGLHEHKFGVPIQQARQLYAQASKEKYLKVAGVSVHIGSQITDVQPFAAAMQRVVALVGDLRADGHEIRYVDAGGGLGIAYQSSDLQDFAGQATNYAEALLQHLRPLNVHLLLEPGRAIVGPSGVLLAQVLYKKTNGNKKFLVVDAAMNDLLRPSLYKAHHEVVPVRFPQDEAREKYDVVGPICESGDFIARDREMRAVAEGDLLAVLDTGAYGMVLSSNYNTRPRPAEVLVDGKSVKLVRRRESINDLLRLEKA